MTQIAAAPIDGDAAPDPGVSRAEGIDASEYTRDVWRLRRLNLAREHGNIAGQIAFDQIPQRWLWDLAKRYARMRLSAGLSVTSVQRQQNVIALLADFIEESDPRSTSAAALTRDLLERWMARTAQLNAAHPKTHAGHLSGIRGFLVACRRYGWDPSLPALAELQPKDFPRRPRSGRRCPAPAPG